MAFLRIRVLNKTSLGNASGCLPLPLPPLLRPKGQSLVRATYIPARSGSHDTASPTSPRPACRRRDLLLLPPRRLRPPSPSSFHAGDREANRKGVHHCRRPRSGRHAVRALADEKNPRERRGREERTAKGPRPEGGGARRHREMRLAFRGLVPPGVYRGKRERTCAPT